MQDSHLHRLHDAIHGPIDYATYGSSQFAEAVQSILASQYMGRLKRVKQLGFVSKNHLSASHDRYTHSIGTMVMMKSLVGRLKQHNAFNRSDCNILADLAGAFPDAFRDLDPRSRLMKLEEHLLLAALTQDMGELPYSAATSGLFEPHHSLVQAVGNGAGIQLQGLEPKAVFTLAALQELFNQPQLESFDLGLVAFLVSGRLAGGDNPSGGLAAVRQMMDGAVDADRLDYVHRDAFHALGLRRDPETVVASLSHFDADGPIFTDSGPVADFFAMRASLWSSIYLHPATRFRTILLRTVLRDVIKQVNKGVSARHLAIAQGGVQLEEFVGLDDLVIDRTLEEAVQPGNLRLTNGRAMEAARILARDCAGYVYYWVGSQEEKRIEPPLIEYEKLPNSLFWDTYSDYDSHQLYELNSVRVEVEHYKFLAPLMPLEDCSGPFNVMLKENISGLPMPGYVTIFKPSRAEPKSVWRNIEAMAEDGSLHGVIMGAATLHELSFEPDTRNVPGFEGPNLLISFAFEDIEIVTRICVELARRRQRYFCLLDRFEGLGATPRQNSVKAVRDADAVLLLYSTAYAAKAKDLPNENLNAEVLEMTFRKRDDPDFRIIPLSTVPFSQMKDGLPWRNLGFDDGQVPMVGDPINADSPDTIREALDRAKLR